MTEPATTNSVRPAVVRTGHPRRGAAPSRWATALRALLGLALIAVGAGVFAALWLTKPEPQIRTQADRVVAVQTVTAVERDVAQEWIGYGSARAQASATIAAEVAGRVIDRPDGIDAGVWVERGDLLVALDAGEYTDRLDAARGTISALEAQVERLDIEKDSLTETVDLASQSVALSERELARARAALAKGAATENEIDRLTRDLIRLRRDLTDAQQRLDAMPTRRTETLAQIEQQRASARLAQRNLERARITAPIAGVLDSIDANVGDWVGVGSPVARIVDLSHIEVPLQLPVSAAGEIRVGDEIRLTADGASPRSWSARIARIAPTADEQTRSIAVFAELEQAGRGVTPGALVPGQFVIGAARSSDAAPRVIVPRTAIIGDRVAVIRQDSRIETRAVRVAFHIEGALDDLHPAITEWAAIESGVTAGERIVTTNLDDIEDGALVRTGDGEAGATTADGRRPRAEDPTP